MKRGTWINLAKFLCVAGLLWLVLAKVAWHDMRTVHRGEAADTKVGRIVGAWDESVVRFEPDDGSVAEEIRPGAQADGSRVEVTPGFLTYVRNIDWWLFALGALCYFVSASFAAIRWWWLLRVNHLDVTPFEAWRFTWIGIFFNNFVPGQTGGDVVKAVYIVKHCKNGNRVAAGVSVLVDRILGLGSLALLAAVVVLFALDRFGDLALGIWAVLLGVMLIGCVAFSRRIRRAVGLEAIVRRLPLSGLLKKVDQAIYFYRGHTFGIAAWMVVGMASHVLSVLSVALIGRAMSLGMPTFEYFVLVPIINIVSAVPLGPNGWGVGEAMFGHLFRTYGAGFVAAADAGQVMYTRGVALSILYRIHLTMWSLLGGLLVLLERDRVTQADVEQELLRRE
ncbi:MAG: lysylphosphatidylglycerol synthase transmembrane domain-containing protein [Planctomycetota bacterium]